MKERTKDTNIMTSFFSLPNRLEQKRRSECMLETIPHKIDKSGTPNTIVCKNQANFLLQYIGTRPSESQRWYFSDKALKGNTFLDLQENIGTLITQPLSKQVCFGPRLHTLKVMHWP